MIFLFPTEREASLFRQVSPDAQVVICGVGMAATAAALSPLMCRDEEFLLAGIAGCYPHSRLAINSVVEVTSECIEELPERFAIRYDVAPRWGLRQVSSATVSRANRVHQRAEIENMEGAVAFAMAQAHSRQISQIRAISNYVDDPFERWQIESAIEALTQTLITL